MGIFFNDRKGVCVLCGSADVSTREHKIKRSALVKEFGERGLYIGNTDEKTGYMNYAQGLKSRHLKFESGLCHKCNTTRTQNADRQFDQLLVYTSKLIKDNQDPVSALDLLLIENYERYIDSFRYFSKILACQISDAGGPVPKRLTNFVIFRDQLPCISLAVRHAPDVKFEPDVSEFPHAGHGGLVVMGNKKSRRLAAFHSMISIGKTQFSFSYRLSFLEQIELKYSFTEFHSSMLRSMDAEIDSTMDKETSIKLGLL